VSKRHVIAFIASCIALFLLFVWQFVLGEGQSFMPWGIIVLIPVGAILVTLLTGILSALFFVSEKLFPRSQIALVAITGVCGAGIGFAVGSSQGNIGWQAASVCGGFFAVTAAAASIYEKSGG
jgi:hypothetical protein